MATREYTIKLIIDTQQLNAAAAQAAKAQGDINKGAQQVAGSVQDAVGQITRMATSVLAVRTAWNLATGSLREYMGELDKLEKKQKSEAENALDKQKALREYARVLNVPNDMKLRREVDAFQSRTGLQGKGGVDFLTTVESNAAQYAYDPNDPKKNVGKIPLIQQQEFDFAKEWAAKDAATSGIEPKLMAQLFSGLAGITDRSKQGNKAGRNLLAQYKGVAREMEVGVGENARNIPMFTQLLTRMVKIDRDKGRVIPEGEDDAPEILAAMMSTVAEMEPRQAAVFTDNAIYAARAFNKKKAAKMFPKAGITLEDKNLSAFRKLGKFWESDEWKKKKGETFADFLRINMNVDKRGAASFDELFYGDKKGIPGARLAERHKINADNVTGMIEDQMRADPSLQMDIAQAQVDAAQNIQGEQTIPLEIARKRMSARFTEKGWGGIRDPRVGQMGVSTAIVNFLGKNVGLQGIDDDAIRDTMMANALLEGEDQRRWTGIGTAGLMNPMTRTLRLNSIMARYDSDHGEGSAMAVFERIAKATEAQAQGPKAVPMPPPQAGMVKP